MTDLADDLSKKMQCDLAEVLDRNLQLFKGVLDPAELTALLVESSLMVTSTSAATIANLVRRRSTEDDAMTICAFVFDRIVSQLAAKRGEVLTRTRAAIREQERGG